MQTVLGNYSFEEVEDVDEIAEIVQEIISSISSNSSISEIDLKDTLLKCEEIYEHSLNVAVIAALLAIKSGKFHRWFIEQITLGALLHDIGAAYLESNEGKKFSELPRELADTHPEVGFELLQSCDYVSDAVKKIVLYHHVWSSPECSPDSGELYTFPKEYKGKKISAANKSLSVSIVQVADTFEWTVKHGGDTYQAKKKAIADIVSKATTVYGEGADLLYKYISPYSVGDIVDLSNGRRAEVVCHTAFPDKPIIKYCGTRRQIDLRKRLFLRIV